MSRLWRVALIVALTAVLSAAAALAAFDLLLGLSPSVFPRILGPSPETSPLLDGFAGGLLGATVTLVVTLALLAVAYLQLSSVASTASADLIFKLKRDFFTDPVRILFQLVDHGWLTLRRGTKDLAYFSVEMKDIDDSGLPAELKQTLKQKPFYSEYEIDDVLLGHFEDMGMLVEKGVLAFDMVYEMFSYYIETVFENRQIEMYMNGQRRGDPGLYANFERIYKECKRADKDKRPH
jgi:hypothetical protein